VIASWTPRIVVSRSATICEIDTFMTLLSSTVTNCAAPSTAIGSQTGAAAFAVAAGADVGYGLMLVLSNGALWALSRMARSLSIRRCTSSPVGWRSTNQ
jgi:hypothetical protein